jgi:hypothetical protein
VKYLQQTVKNGAVIGLDLGDESEQISCGTCQEGKKSRDPHPTVPFPRETQQGQILHVDLSGKMTVESLGKSNYFLPIKDDATGFRMAYFLRKKSQAADRLIEFIAFIETQTARKVTTLRSDCGTEFVNKTLHAYITEKGIVD